MRLLSVDIDGYRSFESGTINSLGQLNVFVGRNSSGKSNILNAAFAAIDFLRRNVPITKTPRVCKEIDHFGRATRKPIVISLTFDAESIALNKALQSIHQKVRVSSKKSPPSKGRRGKKNAKSEASDDEKASESGTWARLLVSVCFIKHPFQAGYLSEVALEGMRKGKASRLVLLKITQGAASSMKEQLDLADMLENDSKIILSKIAAAKKRSRKTSRKTSLKLDQILEVFLQTEMSNPTILKLKKLARQQTLPSNLIDSISTLQKELADDAKRIRANLSADSVISDYFESKTVVPEEIKDLLKLVSKVKILFIRETRKAIDIADSDQLFDFKSHRESEANWKRIREDAFDILGVEIDAFRGEDGTEIDVNRILVQANGAGTRCILRTVIDLNTQKPDILLIEEPEIHLHPGLERAFMRYLKKKSSETQILITTHSSNFIDFPDIQNVYLVSMKESSKVTLLDPEDAISAIPAELGITPSSLFIYDNLVFVEGDSDEAIIREFASTLEVSLGSANLGFIEMEGSRNFSYFAADSTLSFLKKRRIRLWFIVDKDEKDNDDIEKIKGRLGDRAELRVLEKRELENYLLCPRAISEFLKLRVGTSDGTTSDLAFDVEKIEESIHLCADKLKDTAIWKRVTKKLCASLHFNLDWLKEIETKERAKESLENEIKNLIEELGNRESGIMRVLTEVESEIESKWEQKKQEIVPGSLLLDTLFKEYGMRYKKKRDGPLIASLMLRTEIEPEIRVLIEQFARPL